MILALAALLAGCAAPIERVVPTGQPGHAFLILFTGELEEPITL